MKNALVRTALVAIAVVVGAWLAVGYRAIKLEEKGQAAVADAQRGPISPTKARDALRALDDARWLNPDKAPRLIEGNLRLYRSERAAAASIAEQITAEEPQNVSGWFLAVLTHDGAAQRAAARRVNALDPWAGSALR